MTEVAVSINGRTYNIACGQGEEQRVLELGAYVDKTLREVAKAGAATSDSHLLVLTALLISDQLFDSARGLEPQKLVKGEADDETVVKVIDHLAERIEAITNKYKIAA